MNSAHLGSRPITSQPSSEHRLLNPKTLYKVGIGCTGAGTLSCIGYTFASKVTTSFAGELFLGAVGLSGVICCMAGFGSLAYLASKQIHDREIRPIPDNPTLLSNSVVYDVRSENIDIISVQNPNFLIHREHSLTHSPAYFSDNTLNLSHLNESDLNSDNEYVEMRSDVGSPPPSYSEAIST